MQSLQWQFNRHGWDKLYFYCGFSVDLCESKSTMILCFRFLKINCYAYCINGVIHVKGLFLINTKVDKYVILL